MLETFREGAKAEEEVEEDEIESGFCLLQYTVGNGRKRSFHFFPFLQQAGGAQKHLLKNERKEAPAMRIICHAMEFVKKEKLQRNKCTNKFTDSRRAVIPSY